MATFSGKQKLATIPFLLLILYVLSTFSSPRPLEKKVLPITVAPSPMVTPSATPSPRPEADPPLTETSLPLPINQTDTLPNNLLQVTVLRVVDGDTIVVSLNGIQETIRMIGVNSPESVDPRRSVQCFGKEASAFVKNQLTEKAVFLENDPTQQERDRYNRLLRFVFVENTNFGRLLIAEGYAYEYTYNLPYKYQQEYKLAQTAAQIQKKGLWADGACNDQPSTVNNQQLTEKSQQNTSGEDKDCKDFQTHEEAQNYFNSKGGNSTNNIDKLDGSDHDGIVCEMLP